jgi:hypothetical protein
MYIILDELEEGDRFNFITFNSYIEKYKPGMIDVTTTSLLKAKEFVNSIRSSGGKFCFILTYHTMLLYLLDPYKGDERSSDGKL